MYVIWTLKKEVLVPQVDGNLRTIMVADICLIVPLPKYTYYMLMLKTETNYEPS